METVNMLVSGIITKKDRRYARVSFLRGKEIAEGIIPDCIIDHAEGFSDDEIFQLERYLRENCGEIMERARKVNPLKNWLGL